MGTSPRLCSAAFAPASCACSPGRGPIRLGWAAEARGGPRGRCPCALSASRRRQRPLPGRKPAAAPLAPRCLGVGRSSRPRSPSRAEQPGSFAHSPPCGPRLRPAVVTAGTRLGCSRAPGGFQPAATAGPQRPPYPGTCGKSTGWRGVGPRAGLLDPRPGVARQGQARGPERRGDLPSSLARTDARQALGDFLAHSCCALRPGHFYMKFYART